MPKPLDRSAACQAWGIYFRCLADLMWLRDWTITISDSPPEAGAYAAVECLEGRRRAIISLSDHFLDGMSESDQRQVATHELTHLHFEAAAVVAERAMGDRWKDFRLLLEYGVDGIADAFAERLPLPSHVTPKPAKKNRETEDSAMAKKMTGKASKKPAGMTKKPQGTFPMVRGKAGKKGGKMKGDCAY